MRVLFVHQGFPGQFAHLAPALAARGDTVVALTQTAGTPRLPGVALVHAAPVYEAGARHPWARHAEAMTMRAEAALRGALTLRAEGFVPDAIVAHGAWGDALLLKDVWPAAPLGLYCEHFLPPRCAPPFAPEFAQSDAPEARRGFDKMKSIAQALLIDVASAGMAPTRFQRETYPLRFRERIAVIHDGIDTDRVVPRAGAAIRFSDGRTLTAGDEVVVYIARHLEPARGYDVFVRALPALLRARPRAQVVIVGAETGGYGEPPPAGTWRAHFERETGPFDPARVHLVGTLGYATYLDLLAIARLRIYLTHPTVLSWSVLEGMAAGVPTLASDVAPVREAIVDGRTGMLFPYSDGDALVARACAMLEDAGLRARLAANGRRHVVDTYDLRRICLPRQFDWIDRLAASDPLPPVMEDGL